MEIIKNPKKPPMIEWEKQDNMYKNTAHTIARAEKIEDFNEKLQKYWDQKRHEKIELVEYGVIPKKVFGFTENDEFLKFGGHRIQEQYLLDVIEDIFNQRIRYKHKARKILKRYRHEEIELDIYFTKEPETPIGVKHKEGDFYMIAPMKQPE